MILPDTLTGWLGFASQIIGAAAVVMILGLDQKIKAYVLPGFRYPRREGAYVFGLYTIMLLAAFWMYAQIRPDAAPDSLSPLYKQLAAIGAGVVLFGGALVYRRQPLRSVGWTRELVRSAIMLGFAMALLIVFLSGKFSRVVSGFTSEQGITLLILFLIALAEEAIFRGYIQLRLASWLGSTRGWLITAALYMLWQVPHMLHLSEISQPVILLGFYLIQGLFLGWIMQKCKHILAPALFHAMFVWLSALV